MVKYATSRATGRSQILPPAQVHQSFAETESEFVSSMPVGTPARIGLDPAGVAPAGMMLARVLLAASAGGLRHGVLLQALPLARGQVQDQPRRMDRNALDDVAQVDEGIDLQVLAGLHQ